MNIVTEGKLKINAMCVSLEPTYTMSKLDSQDPDV